MSYRLSLFQRNFIKIETYVRLYTRFYRLFIETPIKYHQKKKLLTNSLLRFRVRPFHNNNNIYYLKKPLT